MAIGTATVDPWANAGPTNIAFSAGNVGIGTTAPQTKLHIRGAEEGIRIDGPTTGAPNLAYLSFRDAGGTRVGYVGDGSTGDSSIFLSSDIADVVLNTPAGRVLTATSAGNVGIGTTTPTAKLEVRGDIRLGPTGQFRAISGEENLRIVRGVFDASGNIIVGSGFSVAHPSNGRYDITFTSPFTGAPAVTVTGDVNLDASNPPFVVVNGVTSSIAHVAAKSADLTANYNLPIHFIAIGPR